MSGTVRLKKDCRPLLKTIGGKARDGRTFAMPKSTRPIKEPENIDDLPEESTSEDEPDSPTHVDASDDGAPTADIKRSTFGSKKNAATASVTTGRRHEATGEEPAAETRKRPQHRPTSSRRGKGEDIDTDDPSAVRSKRARPNSDEIAGQVGGHMKFEPITGKSNPVKHRYSGSKKLQSSTPAKRPKRETSDSMSPAKFKIHDQYKSPGSSPVKFNLSQRVEDDEDLSSGLSDPPPSDKSDPPRAMDRRNRNPNLRQVKKAKNKLLDLESEPMSQAPQFKMPDAWRDYAPAEPIQVDTATNYEPVVKRHLDPGMALCPMCDKQVDEALLVEFSKGQRMRLAQQAKFCRLHKKRSAEKTYAEKKYPKIDWTSLEARIEPHHSYLESLIMGTESHFGAILVENIRVGNDRSLATTKEYPTPGYYGLRGMGIMTDAITNTFSRLLRKQALMDTRISGRGHTGFVQSVLVPELAVKLIQEDMSLGEDKAREVMLGSREVGDILNDEKRCSQSQTHIDIHGDNHDEEEEEFEDDDEGEEAEDDDGGGEHMDEEHDVKSDKNAPRDPKTRGIAGSESALSSPLIHEQQSVNGEQSLKAQDSDSQQSRRTKSSDSEQNLAPLGASKSKKAGQPGKTQDVTKLPTRSSPYSSEKSKIVVPATSPIDDSDDSDSSDLSSVLEAL